VYYNSHIKKGENYLPDSVDFTSLYKFMQSISHIDFNGHLMCFNLLNLCFSVF